MTELFDTLYEGWREYRRNVKGYLATPSKIDIEDWERYKKIVLDSIEEKNNARCNGNQVTNR